MKFFLVAGEASGDVHGSNLVNELRKIYPDMQLVGTGGKKLESLGQKQYFTEDDMNIIGFDGIIKKLPFILKMFSKLEEAVIHEKPDAIILVDYPGFNLRFAKRIKKLGIPIIYFIAPQFWVWNYKRLYTLRDYVDLTISILPFETESLKKEGVNAIYVGNPVVDNFKYRFPTIHEFYKNTNLVEGKKVLGILPGSRISEVAKLIPTYVEASYRLADVYQFVISKADSIKDGVIESLLGEKSNIKVLPQAQYDIMKYSDLIWACSGTVTLECAILEKPMVISYRSSALNLFIATRLSSLRIIGLPNIILDDFFIPEIVGSKIETDRLINETKYVEDNIATIRSKLNKVSKMFLGLKPSENSAKAIKELLDSKLLA